MQKTFQDPFYDREFDGESASPLYSLSVLSACVVIF